MSSGYRSAGSPPLTEQGDQTEGGAQTAQRDNDTSGQEAEDVPTLIEQAPSPNVTREDEPEPQTEQPAPHEVRDLVAQETMAEASFWMAVAALGTMIVTLIGTLLIWRQVTLTREAVEDTSEATNAMRDSNEIAASTADAQLRPYLAIENIKPHPIGDTTDEITIWVKNFGHTPAENVRQEVGFAFIPLGNYSWPVFSGEVELGREVAPGHLQRATLSLEGFESEVKAVARKRGTFRIILRISYDGFGKPRPPLFAKIIVSRKGAHVAVESLKGALTDGST